MVSVVKESVNEGIDCTDSYETVLVERGDAMVLSPMDMSSSSKSSGGLSKTSRGPLMKLRLSSFSDSWLCSSIDSTVMRFSLSLTRRCR